MSIFRGSFLRDAGVAAVATAGVQLGLTEWLGVRDAAAASGNIAPRLLDRVGAISRETFTACVSTPFHVRQKGAWPQTLTLEAVRSGAFSDQATLDSFSLRFRAAAGATALEQGTYLMQHRAFGRFGLFVVPIGDDGRGPAYEAVINRLA